MASVLLAMPAGCVAPPSAGGLVAAGGSPTGAAAQPSPHFAGGGPDADEYGAGQGYPIGDQSTFDQVPFLVGSYSRLDRIFEGRLIRRARAPSRLDRAPVEPVIRYEYGGTTLTLEHYLARHPVTGLLVARDETILIERYGYARHDRQRFASWSMAKTVTAMLIGIAIADGHIRSVDDVAATYVPALAGTEYGRTPVRHLLQMSSGVSFAERGGDAERLAFETFHRFGPGGVHSVRPYNDRVSPSGTRFSYSSADTQVLGLVLRGAVGRPLAEYLQETIWQPIGAEGDASWLVDRSGQEAAFCCLNALLRDFARLALLLAHDGRWRGRQVLPASWVAEAARVRQDQPHLRPGRAHPSAGYGYQVWILPGDRRMFGLSGWRGQAILVDPASRVVMVHTAVRKRPDDQEGRDEMRALWHGIVRLADAGGGGSRPP
jgi:CubicO group peptidase (beta-lactamase class C family)